MKKEKVFVCPRCGSTDIKYWKTNRGTFYPYLFNINPSTYFCQNCNYNSYVFPEIDADKAKKIKVKKDIKPYINPPKERSIPLWWKILMVLALFLMAFIVISYL